MYATKDKHIYVELVQPFGVNINFWQKKDFFPERDGKTNSWMRVDGTAL
jgi:hypothetical protein